MKLNHINLVVTDVADAVQFFETYFNFKCTLVKGNNIIAILKGADDFTLVLMLPGNEQQGELTYPKAFHIGFMLQSEQEVTMTYDRLIAGKVNVGREPGKIRESFGFYFHYDKIMIEVGCDNT